MFDRLKKFWSTLFYSLLIFLIPSTSGVQNNVLSEVIVTKIFNLSKKQEALATHFDFAPFQQGFLSTWSLLWSFGLDFTSF